MKTERIWTKLSDATIFVFVFGKIEKTRETKTKADIVETRKHMRTDYYADVRRNKRNFESCKNKTQTFNQINKLLL
jgi:hypothetical protein